MWPSTRFEIKLKNNFPSTFNNAIGQKSSIVEESGETFLGMRIRRDFFRNENQARCHLNWNCRALNAGLENFK